MTATWRRIATACALWAPLAPTALRARQDPMGSGDPAAVSPTGRAPRLLWTPARQLTWARMAQQRDPMFLLANANCNQAMRGKPRYGDRGLWCAWMYQVTGNPRIGRIAWNQIRHAVLDAKLRDNSVREDFIETALLVDWLLPVLTAEEQAAAVAGLNRWARFALAIGTEKYEGGINLANSDEVVGYFFGLAATDIATRGLPGHQPWLDATPQATKANVTVGGLAASGADRRTVRNTISQYVTKLGAGGEWFESTGYNPGTVALLALGYAAVRPALAADSLADVAAFLDQAGVAQVWEVTPDLRQSVQWGSDEHPRQFVGRLFKRATTLALIAGAVEGTPGSSAAQGLLHALLARYRLTGGNDAVDPSARALLGWNPWRTGTPPEEFRGDWFAEGSGHLQIRLGEDQVSILTPPWTGAHHEVEFLSTFQLYRNGTWSLTHPIGYGGVAAQGEAGNAGLVAGLSSMRRKGIQRLERGDDWWAVVASTSGPRYGGGYYAPPPAFLDTWTRTTVFFRRSGVDHFLTIDSVTMRDPRRLPRYDRYRDVDRRAIESAPGAFQWIVHAAVRPDTGAGVTRWNSPRGEPVLVQRISGPPESIRLLDERQLYTTYHISPAERRWQLRLVPEFTEGTLVTVHLLTVGRDAPATVSMQGDTIRIDGVRVVRRGDRIHVEG